MAQLPIGLEDHEGVVDLVDDGGGLLRGDNGENTWCRHPSGVLDEAKSSRSKMIDASRLRRRPRRGHVPRGEEITTEDISPRRSAGDDGADFTPVFWARRTRTRACRCSSTTSTRYLPAPPRPRNLRALDLDNDEASRSSSRPTSTRRSSAWRSSLRTAATGSSRTCASTRGLLNKGDNIFNASNGQEGQGRSSRSDALERDGGHRQGHRRRHRGPVRRRLRVR